MVLCIGTSASTVIERSPILRSTILSIRWKYSRCMAAALRALGSDQFVDACAQVLEDEVLLGGRLAVVDFLGPFLQRQLDPECLVDGECNVQEVQAVDAQIVDRMALGRDRVARDVAGFRNDR